MMPMPGGPSNLEALLKAWGITFETTKVAADMISRETHGARQSVGDCLFAKKIGSLTIRSPADLVDLIDPLLAFHCPHRISGLDRKRIGLTDVDRHRGAIATCLAY